MAKGKGGKSTRVKGAKNAEAGAAGVVIGQPENDPIVVDNPRFRIDLVNLDGLPSGGPERDELLRSHAGMSQCVIFDSEGEHEWRFIELDNGKPLQLVLSDGERIVFRPAGQKVSIKTSKKTTKFIQNDFGQTQFSLTPNPDRRISAIVCEGTDLVTKETYDGVKENPVLSEKGRHVVVLLAGPKRFGAVQLL